MRIFKLAALGLAVIAIVSAAACFDSTSQDSTVPVVAAVNGNPVTAAEFRNELDRQRASVIEYFRQTFGTEYDRRFWKTVIGGTTPGEEAKRRALQEVARSKLALGLAKQYGLVKGIAYPDLLREMDNENKRRQEAVRANQPVYGPVAMDESTFMHYYMSNLKNALIEKLSESELNVSDEELMQYYERVKGSLFALDGIVRFEKVSVSYRDGGGDGGTMDERKQAAQALLESVERQAVRGAALDQAVQEAQSDGEGRKLQMTREELNQGTAGTYFRSQPMLYEILTGSLGSGQIGPVYEEPALGEYGLVRVVEKSEDSFRSFEESKPNVRVRYLNDVYEQYLDKLYSEADIRVYQEEMNLLEMQ